MNIHKYIKFTKKNYMTKLHNDDKVKKLSAIVLTNIRIRQFK